MSSLEWILVGVWITVGLSIPWVQLNLAAPASSTFSTEIVDNPELDAVWNHWDWQTVWQLYCGAERL